MASTYHDFSLTSIRNLATRSDILINSSKRSVPTSVGSLPLSRFIFIIIAILVLLCCSLGIKAVAIIILSPKKYLERTRTELFSGIASSSSSELPYRDRKGQPVPRVRRLARGEIEKLRTQPKYQGGETTEVVFSEKPNLPIPVVVEVVEVQDEATVVGGIDARSIEAWGYQVREREKLNVTIRNLERVSNAQRQAGQYGAMSPKLETAIQKREELNRTILATYERFKENRGEFSAEEWRLIEMILQHSPK